MLSHQTRQLSRDKNVYIIFSVTLLAIMGVASITPAFPKIIRHFNISPHQIGYLITTFTLPGVFLAPVMGVLADRFGRKRILLPSILLFGLAGFACTLTNDFHMLLGLRLIQGVGAASLGMLNVTIIGDLYDGDKRVTLMGYNASVLSIGTASYPAIGGALASIEWYYPFYLPLLAVPVALFVFWGLKNPEPKSIIVFKSYLGNTWKTINRRGVWSIFLLNVLTFMVLYGSYLTYFPLSLEKNLKADSFTIGMTMSIMSFTTAIVSSQLGKLNKLLSSKKLMMVSIFCYMAALLILSFAHSWSLIIMAILIFGMGHGLIIPNIQNQLVGFASISERAVFMSLSSMVLRIGQTLGPVTIGFFYAFGDITGAFIGGALLVVVMLIVTIFMMDEN